jgi:2'-5' RNA ligase
MKNKYFIAIVPPEPLQTQIMQMKHDLHERFNTKGALRSPAHITLHMPFDLEGSKEKRFLLESENKKLRIAPFSVVLNDFSGFEPKVVFIDVLNTMELAQLGAEIVDWMKHEFNIFNQSDDRRGFHPHVTIAFRDLKKNFYFEVMEEFSKKQFRESFLCSAVSVLKHDGNAWQELLKIPLIK